MLETLKRIANALEGVHTELKRLNDTNPSNGDPIISLVAYVSYLT